MLLLPFALSGCGGKEGQAVSDGPVRVKVEQVALSEIGETGHFSGTVEEKNGTPLSFSSAGTIKSMNVRLGDRVAKGQLVATLDDTSARSTHEAAKATLMQAEDAWKRMKELHDKGSLPEIKWVEVESKLKQARSMESVTRKALDDCRLTAPYAGVISARTGEVGQNVMPGMAVATLVSVRGIQVRIDVPEGEMRKVSVGQDALVCVPALDGRKYEAMVAERGIVANPLTRSYPVKLQLYYADEDLLPGMVADVSLQAGDKRREVVLPAYVVQLDEYNHNFVWVERDGKAEKRPITLGGYTPHGVVVAEGLAEGDRVIVEGRQKVCEGSPVESIPDL